MEIGGEIRIFKGIEKKDKQCDVAWFVNLRLCLVVYGEKQNFPKTLRELGTYNPKLKRTKTKAQTAFHSLTFQKPLQI